MSHFAIVSDSKREPLLSKNVVKQPGTSYTFPLMTGSYTTQAVLQSGCAIVNGAGDSWTMPSATVIARYYPNVAAGSVIPLTVVNIGSGTATITAPDTVTTPTEFTREIATKTAQPLTLVFSSSTGYTIV